MLRPVRATPCYNDFGHKVVAGEKCPRSYLAYALLISTFYYYALCRLRFVVPFDRTTQYGRRTWIVISSPVSLQTPPDKRPPTSPLCTPPIDTPGLTARAPGRLALI